MSLLTREEQSALWQPDCCYLDAATYGLPTTATHDAVAEALEQWRGGTGDWQEWSRRTEDARSAFARMLGVAADTVAVGANVSTQVGLLPAALPAGSQVVVPAGEFTSALFPWCTDDRLTVREVPVEALADAVDERTSAVAFSLVRSSDGTLVDGGAVREAARSVGALTVVDVTQAAGWLPVDASRDDVVVCAAYKWLCCPRGTAFLALSDEVRSRVVPTGAGWFAGPDPFGTYYGGPLRLADSARALDVSPAWLPWIGAAAALRDLERVGVERLQRHDVALADAFRDAVGLPAGPTPVVSLVVPGVEGELAAAGIRTSVRAGRVRISFHGWNTTADVDRAAAAVRRARGRTS